MKRDMGLLRSICLEIERADDELDSAALEFDGFTSQQIAGHVQLLLDKDMIDAELITTNETDFPSYWITRLKPAGHDFVDASRNDVIWKQALAKVATATGGATLEVFLKVLRSGSLRALGMSEEAGE